MVTVALHPLVGLGCGVATTEGDGVAGEALGLGEGEGEVVTSPQLMEATPMEACVAFSIM